MKVSAEGGTLLAVHEMVSDRGEAKGPGEGRNFSNWTITGPGEC